MFLAELIKSCLLAYFDPGRNNHLQSRSPQTRVSSGAIFTCADGVISDQYLYSRARAQSDLDGPSWQDMLIVYSTVNEHASARDIQEGCWFTCCLAERLRKMCDKTHLDNILKAVSEDMKKMTAIDSTTGRSVYVVPVIEKRAFNKYLYFNP